MAAVSLSEKDRLPYVENMISGAGENNPENNTMSMLEKLLFPDFL